MLDRPGLSQKFSGAEFRARGSKSGRSNPGSQSSRARQLKVVLSSDLTKKRSTAWRVRKSNGSNTE